MAVGVMVAALPLAYLASLVGRVRRERAAPGRDASSFAFSNWFVWNVQETREEAMRLARRGLGFRLYYIRDVAPSIGLAEADARDLSLRQPEMLRALFRGTESWQPPADVADRLIEHLTLTSDRRGLPGCVERLVEFERLGCSEIALAPHGDPAAAIELIGDAVIPVVDRGAGAGVP